MRATALTIYFLLSTLYCWSQESDASIIGQYRWNNSVVMELCEIDGTSENEEVVSIPGQLFQVLKVLDNDFVLIKVLDYPEKLIKKRGVFKTRYSSNPDPNFKKFNRDESKQKYFRVKKELITTQATLDEMVGGSLAFGVINFPFKFRLQDEGDFSGAFNLGAAVGYKLPHKYSGKFNVSFLLASSLSLVNADETTVSSNEADLESFNNQFSAVSVSGGLMLEYGKVQAGVFVGLDYVRKAVQEHFDWRYHGKPWVSFALGISIFSTEKVRLSGTTDNPGSR